MHFQHAFSSVYASFHVQSCAMCRSNMQIGYSDAPDIVIHFRKSKGHVISDIYCNSTGRRYIEKIKDRAYIRDNTVF